MIITAPVTDYIPASLLTTLNDMVLRGAAGPERQAGLIRAIGAVVSQSNRAAGGNQVIATIGYNPSAVIFVAKDQISTNFNFSVGFDNGTQCYCIYSIDDGTQIFESGTDSMYIRRDAGNEIRGEILSKDADGMTLIWNLVGACGIRFGYFAIP